jgi:hypothetical protein
MIDTITTHQYFPIRSSQTHQSILINLYYFFQIVKEQKQPMVIKTKPKSPPSITSRADLGLAFPKNGGG